MAENDPRLVDTNIAKKAIVFLAITFTTSWAGLAVGAFGSEAIKPLGWVVLPSPALAALACCILFERGDRLKALGLRFRPNWWWLWALFIAAGVVALMVVFTALFSPHALVGADGMARQLALLNNENYSDANAYLLRMLGAMALNILLLSVIAGLAEELGWRGYLYHLWRRYGFWRYSFGAGLVWGLWHVPINYVSGFNYAPEHRLLGVFLFPISTILLSTLMTLVRDRGRSVWAACILHGSYNAFAMFTLIAVDAPQFPWTITGISGIAALAMAAVATTLLQRRDVWSTA